MTFDAGAFRDALGRFPTGVTVVTCRDAEGPLAIVANSFASVSLDPPLVLWSPAKASRRHDAFVAAPRFSIHVIAADDKDEALAFVRDGRAFGPGWETGEDVPVHPGTLARFDCARHAAHDGGDHTIVVGLVTDIHARDGDALIFDRGRYGRFAPEP
ncbi:flavin reductase (DIM6/NTAB) family NADH-FMN oxidoreductase RutF [Hasllibacter halocynthiae]|uniref:Flavin reductase (DIM6/NTAB) family NADH-FMN oxidoreductase RutF n=1 Tax=Hasllibacter halocynthiae TaxID=595589 RepID=A0A2T0X970_9RHOB|nr:flavin reductase family protein [Hasllibacter halocynthiae]PRY95455.1 flavin reductase (DIM6/NTAB) family NADH-FMN oxidoreductase RutF [Hasllibacter halocynthiae]